MSHKFLFYGNGPYANRGCEAIVRGTTEILRRAFGADTTFANACFPQLDECVESDPAIESHVLRQDLSEFEQGGISNRLLARLPYRVRVRPYFRKLYVQRLAYTCFRDVPAYVNGCTASLALGGDNYTLDYGFPSRFLALDTVIRKCHGRLVYWGASIGPFNDSSESFVMRHLRKHGDAFFVREERTLQYLTRHGIRHNVYLAPDPAFVMKPAAISAEELGFSVSHTPIGVNLSPLMAHYVCSGDMDRWTGICKDTLVWLLSEFDKPIVLIPHVTAPRSNDHSFLYSLMEYLPRTDRVFLAGESLSAAQTKWLISQCCCLVAARTHATIASLSSGIPTVSLAYSTKAFGINKQLFGHTQYVVPPEDMTPSRIVSTVKHALANSVEISEHLSAQQVVNERSAFAAGEHLRDALSR